MSVRGTGRNVFRFADELTLASQIQNVQLFLVFILIDFLHCISVASETIRIEINIAKRYERITKVFVAIARHGNGSIFRTTFSKARIAVELHIFVLHPIPKAPAGQCAGSSFKRICYGQDTERPFGHL